MIRPVEMSALLGGAQPVRQIACPCLRNLAGKIREFVSSRWALVLASGIIATACFGALPGLTVAAVGSVIAAKVRRPADPVKSLSPSPEPVKSLSPSSPSSQPQNNVAVFRETLEEIRRGTRIDPALHQRTLRETVVVQPFANPFPPPAQPLTTQIIVSPKTTFEMTRELVQNGRRPLVLDMANAYRAGGGVEGGAQAQEEHVCRQSTLYSGLGRISYPIPERGGILVPHVQFFRNDAFEYLSSPVVADVFASAAYNCNPNGDKPAEEADYRSGMKEKIRTMLRTAIQNGNDSLVLSAFGCGAFRNNPLFISSTYRNILNEPEFRGRFHQVAFGIYDPPGAQQQNLPVFQRTFFP